jgi:AcrR family transcriptional regulator
VVEQTKERRSRRSDGEQTYAAILEAAVRLASVEGLSALTIGRLAQDVGVSKSGLYAHFGSIRQLQLDVIDAARDIFGREVFAPGLEAEPGLAQLEALCEAYLSYIERWVFPGGCFFAGMLAEFDARSGVPHDAVSEDQREWVNLLEGIAREAQQRSELRDGIDLAQLVFDVTAPVQLANYYYVLYRDGVVLDQARASIRTAIAAATPNGVKP